MDKRLLDFKLFAMVGGKEIGIKVIHFIGKKIGHLKEISLIIISL